MPRKIIATSKITWRPYPKFSSTSNTSCQIPSSHEDPLRESDDHDDIQRFQTPRPEHTLPEDKYPPKYVDIESWTDRRGVDMSVFELGMAIWAQDAEISRSSYTKLVEVLHLIDNDEIRELPLKLDTLKSRLEKQLPLLSVQKQQIPVTSSKQPSSASTLSFQYWFDPIVLFHTILCSKIALEKMHFGMAEYVDSPTELWHSRAWGSSITAVSGEFALLQQDDPLFPSDFIEILPSLFLGLPFMVEYCRITFIGRDKRAKSPTIGQVVTTVQPVVSAADLDSLCLYPPSRSAKYILIEDISAEIPISQVLGRVGFELNRHQKTTHEAILIDYVLHFKQRHFRSCLQLHAIRAELELAFFGRDHFLLLPSKNLAIRSLPFLLFIDDFGIHRNMYRALKGFYIIPAGLPYSERRKVGNLFTLTLGPHGASMENIMSSFSSGLQRLSHGVVFSVNGTDTLVNASIMAFTGDMPQQAKNSGALSHQARLGCRLCYCTREQRAHLELDTINHGRYHYQTISYRTEGNAIPDKSAQTKFWATKGLQPEPSSLEALTPTLDLILSRPVDVPHSEWKGLGRLLQHLLFSAVLTSLGQEEYLNAFQQFSTPSTWPRIQSPKHYVDSWSLSEAGRATILTPLILRCNAKETWFQQSYLTKAAATLASFYSNQHSVIDKIIRAHAEIAYAVSIVSTPSAVSGAALHQAVIRGRSAFQRLILPATRMTIQQLQQYLLSGNIPDDVRPNDWLKKLGLPNVHIGLHFQEFAAEYATLMNCNVLSGELKHKIFKQWADHAAPANLMSYLFRRDRVRQSLRLGFFGAWDYFHPNLHLHLKALQECCPKIMQSFTLFDENSVGDHDTPPQPRLGGTLKPLFLNIIQSLHIYMPHTSVKGQQYEAFMQRLSFAYVKDYCMSVRHNHSSLSLSESVKFRDSKGCSRILKAGDFVQCRRSSIAYILGCVSDLREGEQYTFLLIQLLNHCERPKDSVLNLSCYTRSSEWGLVGLPECSPSPEFFVDPVSPTGAPSSSSSLLIHCTWDVDFM